MATTGSRKPEKALTAAGIAKGYRARSRTHARGNGRKALLQQQVTCLSRELTGLSVAEGLEKSTNTTAEYARRLHGVFT